MTVSLVADKTPLRPREAETCCLVSLTEWAFCPPLHSVLCRGWAQSGLDLPQVLSCRVGCYLAVLAAFYVECLLVAFQCCSRMGRTGCEVSWADGEAEWEAFLPVGMSSGLPAQGIQRCKNSDLNISNWCTKQKIIISESSCGTFLYFCWHHLFG